MQTRGLARSAARTLLPLSLFFATAVTVGGCGGEGEDPVNRPPRAAAGPDQTHAVGTPVTLDAGGSSDPDGDALTFRWAFGGRPPESAATLTGADGARAGFAPDVAGTYTLTLTVSDGRLDASDALDVTATATLNAAPSASGIADLSGPAGDAVEVRFTIDDEDPATVTVEATSGDPTLVAEAALEVLGSGAQRSLRITPALAGRGSVRISLLLRDALGAEGEASFTLTVREAFAETLATLTASDGTAEDEFGYAVAVGGENAIVGAPGGAGLRADTGAAYAFRRSRSGSAWTEVDKLVAPDGAANDRFGHAVAVSGNTAIVGAPGGNKGAGAAYVFTRARIRSNWVLEARLSQSESVQEDRDRFGETVAVFGDVALVGAPRNSFREGRVYAFRRSGDVWTVVDILKASDNDVDDFFGESIATSGDVAIIGASGDDEFGEESGAAYLFVRSGDVWTEHRKLFPGDGSEPAEFGRAVAIDSEHAVVGARSGGAAYVFSNSGGAWHQVATLGPNDRARGGEFGAFVALDGDVVLVGANWRSASVRSAYAFQERDDLWSEVGKVVVPAGTGDEYFGVAVAIGGDVAFVGAPGNDAGSVYLFAK